jgi:hypothetical protein
MADFKLEVNIPDITKQFKECQAEVEVAVRTAVGGLAASTYAKSVEMARDKLKSTYNTYVDALQYEKITDNIWVVSLDMDKAGWIEDGRKAGFMEELLRGKSAKTSKTGKKYAVIPFQHNKNPSQQSPKALNLTNQVKDFLEKKNVSYQKLEFNKDGSPKMGLLHKFDIESAKPSEKAQHPALKGLAIYQRKNAEGQVKRDIMTFRVITEDHKADGRWVHPGRQPAHIIDDVYNWAIQAWDTEILPSVLKGFK